MNNIYMHKAQHFIKVT